MPSQARPPRERAGERPRSAAVRPLHAWSVLDRDRRLAAGAALALFATMLLPWYQQNAVVNDSKTGTLVSQNLNAFAVFSFVEAAVLLVAGAVLVLLYERAQGATFHLPGSDGAVIFAGGLWTALLLVLRLFDKPGITHNGVAANVGVQWGIFFALAAAGLLAYAGSRMRATRQPEPPLLRTRIPTPRGRRRASTADVETRWTDAPVGQPAADIQERPPVPNPARAPERIAPDERPTVTTPRRSRPRYPPTPAEAPTRADAPAAAEQLSFEDSPPDAG
ncbi:MAG TPA: hypothetical protein VMS02_00710 [Solirubrobacteraceae bacterium]|nr:hypothetical protein [Solirubrobacteraceae bacterium]